MSTLVAERTPSVGTGQLVAAMLLGSALIHATVVEEHLDEWRVAGLFFLGLVLGETLLAVVALGDWSRLLAAVVVTFSLAMLATWVVSRTSGMPLGPDDFRVPEAVGVPDLACGALELAAVGLSLRALRRRPSRRVAPEALVRVLTVLALVGALTLTAWGLHPSLSGGPAPAHHHGAT